MTRKKKESLYMVGADGIEENRFQLWLIESEDVAPRIHRAPCRVPCLILAIVSPPRGRGGRRGVQFQI